MKKGNFKDLKLKQLSESVTNRTLLTPDRISSRLKDIREGLGMTQSQLAKKLGVSRIVISRIEKNAEASSIKTLVKIARAMGCDFMGTVISQVPLENMIRDRAEKTARKLVDRTYANMAMEEQHPGDKDYEYRVKKLASELAAKPGSGLWED